MTLFVRCMLKSKLINKRLWLTICFAVICVCCNSHSRDICTGELILSFACFKPANFFTRTVHYLPLFQLLYIFTDYVFFSSYFACVYQRLHSMRTALCAMYIWSDFCFLMHSVTHKRPIFFRYKLMILEGIDCELSASAGARIRSLDRSSQPDIYFISNQRIDESAYVARHPHISVI